MMKKLRLVAFSILFLLITACTGVGDYFRSDTYIVQKGDSLSTIAFRYQTDIRDLLKWNKMTMASKLVPGQKIYIRPPYRHYSRYDKKPETAGPKAKTAAKQAKKSQTKPAKASNKSRARPPKISYKNRYNWLWPVRSAKLLKNKSAILKGLRLTGKQGDNVYAVASGTVIYSGNGLKQYGNLVIIKHKDHLLSAYAFNSKNLVKEKEKVRQGQIVAMMGTRDKKGYLYFEIRKNGKPVNPLYYLKPR